MNKTIEEFVEEYTETVQDCERFTFLPRGESYQKEAIKSLSELLEKSGDIRMEMIEQGDEEAANQVLALRCMIQALRYELKMWIDLKEEDWGSAWNALVDAQDSAKSARSAHDLAEQCNVENYLGKLEMVEKFVFPPQTFNSPGLYVETFLCSICGEDYSECEHIAGEPYWGFFCQRVVDNIAGTREVSIVENPEDKKARMTEHITDDGMIRDQLTWKKREMTEEEKENYEDQDDDSLITRGIVMTADDSETDFTEYFPD
ncbi:hypothetical protein EGH24_05945 [Halonotius terrestris]|uniref:Uncharacterized protein n=1 Tax=Halonotius terrestris TaxID=2487750 RepID=A0A8J8PAU1_9EURY|nr:hypothetical protein [Halonotius terrestris]TQQ82975.1 hypothetical protein EGH24_05945 [Halonotius terrestris]